MTWENKVGELSFNCLGCLASICRFDLLILIFVPTSQNHIYFPLKIKYPFFGGEGCFVLLP